MLMKKCFDCQLQQDLLRVGKMLANYALEVVSKQAAPVVAQFSYCKMDHEDP